jgi:hypothetical protein
MSRFVEIRSYNLKPGSRDEFSVILEMDDATVRGLRR